MPVSTPTHPSVAAALEGEEGRAESTLAEAIPRLVATGVVDAVLFYCVKEGEAIYKIRLLRTGKEIELEAQSMDMEELENKYFSQCDCVC